MGTPMLLSDLDVHREQMGEKATYFQRYCPASLANALQHFPNLDEIQREKLAEDARRRVDQRVIRFGENFVRLAEDVCGTAER